MLHVKNICKKKKRRGKEAIYLKSTRQLDGARTSFLRNCGPQWPQPMTLALTRGGIFQDKLADSPERVVL